jgi:hypothetical protein
MQNSSGVIADLGIPFRQAIPIRDQATGGGELAPDIDRRDGLTSGAGNHVRPPVGEQDVALHDHAAGLSLGERGEYGVDLALVGRSDDENRPADLNRRRPLAGWLRPALSGQARPACEAR